MKNATDCVNYLRDLVYYIREVGGEASQAGQSAFDAAALQAAPTLKFTPARRGDTAVVAPIQVPIHFSIPDSLQSAGPD